MPSKWLGCLFAFLSILGLVASPAGAQDLERHDAAVTLRYFGETLVHGGATVGGEAYLAEGPNTKMILAPNIGYYLHPQNHHGVFVDLEYGGRLTADIGLFGDAFVGLGYFHRVPAGSVYSVDDQSVGATTNLGDPNLMGTAWLGVGWDLERNDLAPLTAHLRAGGFLEYPFNNVILPHTALQAGVAYKF